MENQLSHFYLTLPSDSSMHVFPNNTITEYRVALEPPLSLNSEEWEVGLASADVPLTWNNIQNHDNQVLFYPYRETKPEFEEDRIRLLHFSEVFNPLWQSYTGERMLITEENTSLDLSRHKFKAGLYLNIESLLSPINELIDRCLTSINAYERGKRVIWFDYNECTRHVELHTDLYNYASIERSTLQKLVQDLQNYAIVLQGRELLSILGYIPNDNHYIYMTPMLDDFKVELLQKKIISSPMTADIQAGFHQLYIYCDVVKPQRIGNVHACFLEHISISKENKSLINKRPNPIHYLPLGRSWINSVHIYLRNELGEKIPFTQGKVLIKLHFKRRLLA